VLGVSVIGGIAIFAADILFGVLGKDSTLTGRTEIWGPAIRQAETRPLTGFGYGAVWNDESGWGPVAWITRQAGFRAYHAHNSWIAIWLETGFIGLGAWCLLFAETAVLALIAPFRHRGAWLALPFLVAYAMMSFSETVIFNFNDLRWVIFVAIACKLAAPHPAPAPAAWHGLRPRSWVEPVFRQQAAGSRQQ
jgi:exopolysaccharide production protein ExoQ